jgi:GTP-binding protein HflX
VSVDKSLDPQTSLFELSELARIAGVVLVDAILQNRRSYDPKFVMGRGKLDELLLRTMQLDCELVIFDQDLTPNQVRAISAVTDLKVIDRSLLILDIFARRAHTREGKLAVELAQQRYLLPRLVHNNSAFSRLAGGIGGRGPGETKLEIDRRRARDRIHFLERALEKAQRHRENQRARRKGREVPHIAIIGYTNAGKSTLFNTITQSEVLSEDKLFATLHVTTRRLRFPHNQELLFTDTVGFIRDLPKDLEVAFKATLEEAYDADLLLHVVDASDPQREAHIESVKQILAEMELIGQERVLVFNKIDLLNPTAAQNLCQLHDALGVSALDRATTRPLLQLIQARLGVELLDWAELGASFELAPTVEALSIQVWEEDSDEAELDDEERSALEMSEEEAAELASYYQAQYQQAPPQESAAERRAKRRKAEEDQDFWAD